jgi:hypothetical protein
MKTVGQKKFGALAVAFVALCALILSGCTGAVPYKPVSAKYSLKVLLEKNIDAQADYLYIEFLRDSLAFSGAFVVVGGDTIHTDVYGQADTSFLRARWAHGAHVQVKAVDTAEGFSYLTTVAIPDSFGISNIFPNTRIWQPNKANPRAEWTASAGASNYIAALEARLRGSASLGQSVIAGSTRSQTFTPTAFYNPNNNQLVPDVYYIHIVAYSPTLILRPFANYTVPADTFPLSVSTNQITGQVAAAVVAARDSVIVSPLQ